MVYLFYKVLTSNITDSEIILTKRKSDIVEQHSFEDIKL